MKIDHFYAKIGLKMTPKGPFFGPKKGPFFGDLATFCPRNPRESVILGEIPFWGFWNADENTEKGPKKCDFIAFFDDFNVILVIFSIKFIKFDEI